MIGLNADTFGYEALYRDWLKIQERAQDVTPVIRKAADLWKDRQREAFKSLPALKDSTVKRKGGNKTPLVRSGKLWRSTFQHSPVTSTRTSAVFGVPKGTSTRGIGVLQARGSRARVKRDPVKGWTTEEREKIREMLREHLLEGLQ